MNPQKRSWLSRRHSPISRLMSSDDCLIPDHVKQAIATPPRGYLDKPRNTRRQPDPNTMFVTEIPVSRHDADQYLSSACYPHTRTAAFLRATAEARLPSGEQIFAIFTLWAISVLWYFSYARSADTIAATIITWVAIVIGTLAIAITVACLGIIGADAYLESHRETYAHDAPTALMRKITERSIDVTTVDSRLARLAWDIYLYDTDNYDELVALIQYMRDNPAERGSKTYGVYQQIIDTFRQASELRQETARQALNDRKKEHETQQLAQLEHTRAQDRALDEMRADMLEDTVLARLRAQASAAEAIYGDARQDPSNNQ